MGTLLDALVDYVRVYKSSSPLGFKTSSVDEEFIIYPNPAKNSVTIMSLESDFSLQVYDLNGKKIVNIKKVEVNTINLSSFAKGTYIFITLTKENGSVQKVIIE